MVWFCLALCPTQSRDHHGTCCGFFPVFREGIACALFLKAVGYNITVTQLKEKVLGFVCCGVVCLFLIFPHRIW